MKKDTWVPDKLLHALSTSACEPCWAIQEIDQIPAHGLRKALDKALQSIPQEISTRIFGYAHFQERLQVLNVKPESRQARIEILAEYVSQSLYEKRASILQKTTGVVAPYAHPALADLEPDDDQLVPLDAFTTKMGYLGHGGYAFSTVPPLREMNSNYWWTKSLIDFNGIAEIRIRLDPLLVTPEEDFQGCEYRMRVYGQELDWERIARLKTKESARWIPDELSRSDIEFTDLVWYPRKDGIHFECEEVPKDAHRRPGRYFHAIFNSTEGSFQHTDAAMRYYTNVELKVRHTQHLKNLAKVGTRIKLFRIDGEFDRTAWCTTLATTFVWNYDITRYVLGERVFEQEFAPLLNRNHA